MTPTTTKSREKPQHECQRCGYKWEGKSGKVKTPKSCPRCKRYDWRAGAKESEAKP